MAIGRRRFLGRGLLLWSAIIARLADMSRERDIQYLEHAARLALRGHGYVEPNPRVGCVIVNDAGCVVGWGYHRAFGSAHAEIEALRRAGHAARGSTVYVTLEPCSHHGKTPPCIDALLEAGVKRVVIAQADPQPDHTGGAELLRGAGIEVAFNDRSPLANDASAPFRHRVNTGLPWITAKWAQTIDGRIATRTGASQWISSDRSRRIVHRERGRVDAILTGIGTVLHDDPLLTARGGRIRRVAKRIVLDPELCIPVGSKLVRTARDVPVIVLCQASRRGEQQSRADGLLNLGVELMAVPGDSEQLDLAPALRELTSSGISTMLVEAGPSLLGSLFKQRLVSEAWVFTAPLLFGDEESLPAAQGMRADELADGTRMQLRAIHRRDDDIFARYIMAQ